MNWQLEGQLRFFPLFGLLALFLIGGSLSAGFLSFSPFLPVANGAMLPLVATRKSTVTHRCDETFATEVIFLLRFHRVPQKGS